MTITQRIAAFFGARTKSSNTEAAPNPTPADAHAPIVLGAPRKRDAFEPPLPTEMHLYGFDDRWGNSPRGY